MHRATRLTIAIVTCLMLQYQSLSIAQTSEPESPRVFNPPIINIEISGKEPVPDGVDKELFFAGPGGGGASPEVVTTDIIPKKPFWNNPPAFVGSYLLVDLSSLWKAPILTACGYKDKVPPVATITFPSGKTKLLEVNPERYSTNSPTHCWTITVGNLGYGAELGLYGILLTHAEGELTYQWGVEHPFCPVFISSSVLEPSNEYTLASNVMLGYKPNSDIKINLYGNYGDHGNADGATYEYLATRTIQVDENGAAIFNVSFSRSVNFQDKSIVPVIASATLAVNPRYSSYTITTFDMVLAKVDHTTIPSPYPCSGNSASFAQVAPQQGLTLTMYQSPTASSSEAGTLIAGEPVEVLEQKPIDEGHRIAAWYRVINETGTEGWITGPNIIGAYPQLVEGGSARVVTERNNGHPVKYELGLLKTPGNAMPPNIKTRVPNSTKVTLLVRLAIGDGPESYDWWYVRTDDGKEGWFPYEYLDPLPWKPIQVDANINVNIGGGGAEGPVPNGPKVCSNSPAPRLTVGQKARVTPGDPNSLRSSPTGNKVGTLPGGSRFTVLDGPQCGAQNRTYWKVDFNGKIGWTAEGEGNVYWLEPVN